MAEVRYIDLFAGLGGIRLGFANAFEKLGIETKCVFSSEIKEYAKSAYTHYFGDDYIHGDITQVANSDIPDFDFLLAGFPCQPFSSAGLRLGFTDTRGTLFFEIERILKSKIDKGNPASGFLLENVEGLITHDGGKTLSIIINHLEQMGYVVSYRLIDSQYFGLAQSRKRVYIVGLYKGTEINLADFPTSTACVNDILERGLPTMSDDFTLNLLKHYPVEQLYGKSIKDKRGGSDNIHSWELEIKGKTSQKQRKLMNQLLKERRKKKWAEEIGIKWMDGMPLTESQIRTFFDDDELHSMLEDLTDKGYVTYEHPKEFVNGRRVPDESKPKGYNIVAGKLSFKISKVIDPYTLSPTLVAMDMSRLAVPDGDGLRRLTVREGQRLCGYPEEYDLSMVKESEAFDLLGNTVCVPVITAISERIGQAWLKQ